MVCLPEHLVKVVEGEVFGEELVGEAVHLDQSLQLHDACGVEQSTNCNTGFYHFYYKYVTSKYGPVMSPASNLEIQRSRDLCSALLILWWSRGLKIH